MTDAPGGDWFQQVPCGVVAVSADGTVLDVNERFLTWTGYGREDITGRAFASLLEVGSRLLLETHVTHMLHLRGAVDEVAVSLVTAGGAVIPALINVARDARSQVTRIAVFNATERVRYERELLAARRAAESSERRVRILQELSNTFGLSATDEDVARSFADAAREAFGARETAVHLVQDDGELALTAGRNPLAGKVAPVPMLRTTAEVTVVTADDPQYPEVAAGLRDQSWSSLSVTPRIADGQRLGILVCFFADRAEFDAPYYDLQQALGRQASQTLVRVRLQRTLAVLALHDQLTGAANRQLLQTTLDDAIAASTLGGEPLAVLFLDIDEFKKINDAFGHAAGDMVLVELASRLTGGVRAGDTIGRIGGDEFVAICAGADQEAAATIAGRLLAICRTPIPVTDGVVSASVSAGISVYRPPVDAPPTAQQMLARADAAMYDSKRAGKDRITLHAPD